jgi:predicted ATPase
MIEEIEFKNYKALHNSSLPLAPFTLLMGPNGSGKTSVLHALEGIAQTRVSGNTTISGSNIWHPLPSAMNVNSPVKITLHVRLNQLSVDGTIWHKVNGAIEFESKGQSLNVNTTLRHENGAALHPDGINALFQVLRRMRIFSLDASAIAQSVQVTSEPLAWNGTGLAAVLDEIKDNYPERWELLLDEMREWLPEYDHIQFAKPENGRKALALRTKRGSHMIPASQLSQGTLIALALLTLAYQPNPPSLIGLEEIDRGLHPRLLRHLQDALYRLSYPESCGEKRPPIQVIATTHSPYLLDLYREHPEEVVLAQKEGLEVKFKRLSEIEHFHEILGDAPLSEVWYSGVLGGVTVKP